MNFSSTEASYLKYVSQVLGARQVLLPESLETRENKWKQAFHTRTGYLPEDLQFDLIVVNFAHTATESLFNAQTDDLYQKMKIAMKLQDKRILEVDTSLSDIDDICRMMTEVIDCPYLLFFNHETTDSEIKTKSAYRVLQTFSPAVLLKTPEKKKIVWDSLQILMRAIG